MYIILNNLLKTSACTIYKKPYTMEAFRCL